MYTVVFADICLRTFRKTSQYSK